jgi:hypothetical protein
MRRRWPFIAAAAITVSASRGVHAQECASPVVQSVELWSTGRADSHIPRAITQGQRCFYYVEPTRPTDDLTLEIQSTRAIGGITVERGARAELLGVVESRAGNVYTQRIRLLEESSATYRLILLDSVGGRVEELELYAPRIPRLTFRLPTIGCPDAAGCLLTGRKNYVAIEGTHLDEIDMDRPARGAGNVEYPISIREGRPVLEITPTATQTLDESVVLYLRSAHLPSDATPPLKDTLQVPLAATAQTPRVALDLFSVNSEQPVSRVYAGSTLSVRTRIPSTGQGLQLDRTYAILETPDDTLKRLATLRPYIIDPAGWVLSRLSVSSASSVPATPDSPPILYVMLDDTIVGTTTLALVPRPRVEKVEVARGGTLITPASLRPDEPVVVYLSGPSVTDFRAEPVAPPQMTVAPGASASGRLALNVRTPRVATPFYEIRLAAEQGVDTVIRVEARQQQQPRRLNFGTIRWASGNPEGKSLESVGGAQRLGSLQGMRLSFDPTKLDEPTVYGVQYLVLKAKLVDHSGAIVDSAVHRFAVKPVGEFPYTVEGGYVQTSEVDVDALLSDAPLGSKTRSTLLLSLGHDPERYSSPLPAPFNASFVHRGRLLFEPSFTLPTAIYVAGKGFPPEVATLLAGAFVDLTWYPHHNSRRSFPLSLRTGILAVDPTFLPRENRGAKLAPTALLNYSIATVRRNLTLTVSAGGMYLNRHNDHLWGETEDFFLLFSPGLTYTIK